MTSPSRNRVEPIVVIKGVAKRFTLHTQGGVELAVLDGIDLVLRPGECVALNGPSGVGKSTLLRLIYGNYRSQIGSIRVRQGDKWTELVGADPRTILALRHGTIGYVSQFLRAVPRVAAIDVVAEPQLALGATREEARARAAHFLAKLNIAEGHWGLSPATFSGGEQQRVNIARGFIVEYPVLLLDEPTASLDAANRDVVVSLIKDARERGAAILGIFHDQDVRGAVADSLCELSAQRTAA